MAREMVTLKHGELPPGVGSIVLRGSFVAMVQEDGTVLVPKEVAEEDNTLTKLGISKALDTKASKKKATDDKD